MKKFLFIVVIFSAFFCAHSQNNSSEEVIERVEQKLNKLKGYEADVQVSVLADFINMPTKNIQIKYVSPNSLTIQSQDFVLIPKNGVDFTYKELFSKAYVAIALDDEMVYDQNCKVIKIIPMDGRSKYVLVTFWINSNDQIQKAEIFTKENGNFQAKMLFASTESVIPKRVEMDFEIRKLKIPLKFLGKNNINKKNLKDKDPDLGQVILVFYNCKEEK